MVLVKICGLTRPDDAAAAAAAGAWAVGLVFAPSPRRVTAALAKDILAAVPDSVVRVGVFVRQPAAVVRKIVEDLGLDAVQLHGGESSAYLARLSGHKIIYALRPANEAGGPALPPEPAADAYLVDACDPIRLGGTGCLANWTYARGLGRLDRPVILSGGLTPANVASAIKRVRPQAVDVSSGVEESPGRKDHRKIRAFMRAVMIPEPSGKGSC